MPRRENDCCKTNRTYDSNESKNDILPLGDLRSALFRHDRSLSRPSGALAHVGGLHPSGIPLDQPSLRLGDGHILARICRRHALRGPHRRQARHQARLHVEHRHLVGGRLPPCVVRRGHRTHRRPARRGGPARRGRECRSGGEDRAGIAHSVHHGPLRAGHRRGGQLSRGDKGHRRVFPQEGSRVRHQHI